MEYRTYRRAFGFTLPFVVALAAAGMAPAQDATCACQVANTGTGLQGMLSNISGRVLRSAENGFVPASDGDEITQSTRLLSGPDGTGTVVFGASCSVALTENSRLTIADQGPTYCVSSMQNVKAATNTAAGATAKKAAVVATGLTAGNTGAIAAFSGLAIAAGVGSSTKSP